MSRLVVFTSAALDCNGSMPSHDPLVDDRTLVSPLDV